MTQCIESLQSNLLTVRKKLTVKKGYKVQTTTNNQQPITNNSNDNAPSQSLSYSSAYSYNASDKVDPP